MHVTVFTTGRFHLLDLARELHLQGITVTFRSAVPTSRAVKFGIPASCCSPMRCIMPLQWNLMRTKSRYMRTLTLKIIRYTVDKSGAFGLPRSDVFIGISGLSGPTGARIRNKTGGQIWIERGSRHILSQKRILSAIDEFAAKEICASDVHRELADYDMADRVVIPSKHVEESFSEENFPAEKLFRNPYGVDLAMFPATPPPAANEIPTVVMAGKWSKRKGCDVLAAAWLRMNNIRLLHVGQQGDLPFPCHSHFEHIPHLNQSKLTEVYRRAHVGVLASREEGLSIVQAQMLASGLHLVCSDRTGGQDLGENAGILERIIEVKAGDIDSLHRALTVALEKSKSEDVTMRMGVRKKMERNSWNAYGTRYAAELIRSLNTKLK
jgi:alpha-maltose-1-phosphate synthase